MTDVCVYLYNMALWPILCRNRLFSLKIHNPEDGDQVFPLSSHSPWGQNPLTWSRIELVTGCPDIMGYTQVGGARVRAHMHTYFHCMLAVL